MTTYLHTIIECVRYNCEGEFWVDIKFDGKKHATYGPFESEGQQRSFYDFILGKFRNHGAEEIPARPQ